MSDGKQPYCTNSRRWLDFEFQGAPSSCPERWGDQKDCIYHKCGYYEERPPNAYYRRKMKILKSYQ